jgi:acid stress-induced BolA-like protein IbaG/YrbA
MADRPRRNGCGAYVRLAFRQSAHEPMDPRDIAQLIEQHLPGAKAEVQTDGQGHYEARVVCAAFAGKRSLQRHQMVYGTLGTRVGREIHALALETLTPEEWQARSA